MEILIAVALFAILLAAALPLLNQAGRNLAFAQEGYAAHLSAQGIMLAVRDAVDNVGISGEWSGFLPEEVIRATAVEVAADYAAVFGVEDYSVWIFGLGNEIYFNSPDAPESTAEKREFLGMNIVGSYRIIAVVVWNRHGYMSGRAVGGISS